MKLYNTMSHSKEEFVPVKSGEVSIYVCGPTVYNHIHVGNARTFVSFDMIRRHFINSGFKVKFVSNLTDIDDKIINKANEEGKPTEEIARIYSESFIDVMHELNVMDPDIRPKATENIGAMINSIDTMIKNGNAYETQGDVYFAVNTIKNYGQLSRRTIDELQSSGRIENDPKKRAPEDFALWKAAKPDEPYWDAPWSAGRPGWHTECTAMADRYLGRPIDIHGGGIDLVFPHHENELAQAESCFSGAFAKYWVHGGMLMVDKEKMSKSEGNFLLLKEVLENVKPQVLRLMMAQTHYRSPLDYSEDRLHETESALEKILSTLRNLAWSEANDKSVEVQNRAAAELLLSAIAECRTSFLEAMDDDFNSAEALGALFTLVGKANVYLSSDEGLKSAEVAKAAYDAIIELLAWIGIDVVPLVSTGAEYPLEVFDIARDNANYSGDDIRAALDTLLEVRKSARADKNFALADNIRDELKAIGLTIEDTPSGARVVIEK